MKPEEWLEGLKTPVFIDDPVGGTCKDSIHAHRATFLEEGARIVRDLLAQVDAIRAGVAVVVPEEKMIELATLKMMVAYKALRREHPQKPSPDIGWMEVMLQEALKILHSVPASRVLKDGEVAVQSEYFEALENGDDVIRPYSVWLHDVFALRAQGKEGAT